MAGFQATRAQSTDQPSPSMRKASDGGVKTRASHRTARRFKELVMPSPGSITLFQVCALYLAWTDLSLGRARQVTSAASRSVLITIPCRPVSCASGFAAIQATC